VSGNIVIEGRQRGLIDRVAPRIGLAMLDQADRIRFDVLP
jgi:hypothetical protein